MLKHRLSPSERKFYDELKAQCAVELQRLGAEGAHGTPLGYTNVLMMLLRLRQAASHPWLVTGGAREDGNGMERGLNHFFVSLHKSQLRVTYVVFLNVSLTMAGSARHISNLMYIVE